MDSSADTFFFNNPLLADVLAYLHVSKFANLHTCILAHWHTSTSAFLNTCAFAYFHFWYFRVCILAHLHTFAFAYLDICILAHSHTCTFTYKHFTNLHICTFAQSQTCTFIYLHFGILAHLHTYVFAFVEFCVLQLKTGKTALNSSNKKIFTSKKIDLQIYAIFSRSQKDPTLFRDTLCFKFSDSLMNSFIFLTINFLNSVQNK